MDSRMGLPAVLLLIAGLVAYTALFVAAISSLWGWWTLALVSTGVFVAHLADTWKRTRQNFATLPAATKASTIYVVLLTALSVIVNTALGLALLFT